jgi:hypothetical protein
MRIKILFLFSFIIYSNNSWSQEKRLKYIGVESGITFISSVMANKDNVRGDIPNYYDLYSSSSLTNLCSKSFVGVKSEIYALNDRFGLSLGLRYSYVYCSIGKKSYWQSNTNYFYWLNSTDGLDTEYLKVKEIEQNTNYLGVPVEIRFFTGRRPHLFRFYLKLGAEINCLVQTSKNVVFADYAMNPYKGEVTSKIAKPKSFYGSVYGGAGLRIGKDLKPSFSIEASLPYLVLSQKSFGLVNPDAGGGFQLNFQIPIKSKTL